MPPEDPYNQNAEKRNKDSQLFSNICENKRKDFYQKLNKYRQDKNKENLNLMRVLQYI